MFASVLDPLYQLMAYILAAIYSVVPNYAVAIFGLTCIVLAILTPLTLKGLRSTIKIQKLMPEQKRLQAEFKDDRQALNAAIMAMYKENKVSPVGGCLPFLVQSPFFIALFGVLRGMSRVRTYPASVAGRPYSEWGTSLKVGRGKKGPLDAIRFGDPQHLPQNSRLDRSLRGLGPEQWFESSGVKRLSHAPGEVKAFGFDLARSASEMVSKGFLAFLPYLTLIVLMVGLQVFAQRQVNRRNPAAAAANPQMQTITKVMPFMFGIFGWGFQAGLTMYWTTSSLLRIIQQWALYRFDPTLAESVKEKRADLEREASKGSGKKAGKPGLPVPAAPEGAVAGLRGRFRRPDARPERAAGRPDGPGKKGPGSAKPKPTAGRAGGTSGGKAGRTPPSKPSKQGAKPAPKASSPPGPTGGRTKSKPNLGPPPTAPAGGTNGGSTGGSNGSNGSGSATPRPNPGRQQPKKRRKGR